MLDTVASSIALPCARDGMSERLVGIDLGRAMSHGTMIDTRPMHCQHRSSMDSIIAMLRRTTFASPLGTLTLVADDAGLVALLWPDDAPARVPLPVQEENAAHPVLAAAASQLTEYFAGTRTAFDLPLAPRGTAFQCTVWSALGEIPFGETRSYAEVARAIDRPAAVRAVGAANGRNPLSIVLPCHRVVGSGGALTGFAGGLAAKRWLLAHEGVCNRDLFP